MSTKRCVGQWIVLSKFHVLYYTCIDSFIQAYQLAYMNDQLSDWYKTSRLSKVSM